MRLQADHHESKPRHGRLRPLAAAGLSTILFALMAACGSDGPARRETVEVFGPIVGSSGAEFARILADASAESTVELRYVGVTSFNEQLEDRLARGDRPGIVLLSQPGLLADLTARGIAVPLPDDVAEASADRYPSQLLDAISRNEQANAIWLTVDIKGLIWYRPDEFVARNLEVPTTLDQLAELSEQLRADEHVAPWCLTMEAGASTGWVGTDWVEDYVLRRLGPATYADWTDGLVRFDSAEVRAVFDELDALLRAPGAVAGGQRAILTVPWERTANLIASETPSCLMAHQGDFLRRELPPGVEVAPRGAIDFFRLPGVDVEHRPLLVGGMIAAPLDASPEVATAIGILGGVDLAERLDGTTGFLSPRLGVDPAVFDGDPTSARLLELVADSTVVEFDGSDLMPASVGTGTFWTGMRSFFAGENIDDVLIEIDAGWPPIDR